METIFNKISKGENVWVGLAFYRHFELIIPIWKLLPTWRLLFHRQWHCNILKIHGLQFWKRGKKKSRMLQFQSSSNLFRTFVQSFRKSYVKPINLYRKRRQLVKIINSPTGINVLDVQKNTVASILQLFPSLKLKLKFKFDVRIFSCNLSLLTLNFISGFFRSHPTFI